MDKKLHKLEHVIGGAIIPNYSAMIIKETNYEIVVNDNLKIKQIA